MEATDSIVGCKRGSVLHFERGAKQIAFDLKDLKFYRILKNGTFKETTSGQAFFRKLDASQIADGFRDEAYAKLIRKVSGSVYNYRNFASIFSQVKNYMHLESYLLLGIEVDTHSFKNPANQFSKEVLEFMKESGIRFASNNFEMNFIRNPKLVTDVCTFVRRRFYLDLEVYRMVYEVLSSSDRFEKLWELTLPLNEKVIIKDGRYEWNTVRAVGYGCEYKALLNYLVRVDRTEAVDFDDALNTYRDYLNMSREMEKKKALIRLRLTNPAATEEMVADTAFGRVEKYPAYLQTRHDIVAKNYRAYRDSCDEIQFKQNVEYRYEYVWGGYRIVAPKTSSDVQNEGSTLHHCVASYVKRILDGHTQILFMRKEENESLVTVEVRAGSIVQARGYNNRSIDAVEKRWLETFARAKNLSYGSVKRDEKMPTPPVVALVKWDSHIALLRELSTI